MVSTLACIVVFITVYALILPAITVEHKTLECGVEIHSHDQTCYDESGTLTCGKVDYVVHTHDDSCYDSDRELICTLPEIQEHQHTDSCYEEVDGEKVLTCDKEEIIVHQHNENCYDKDGNLICNQTEVLSHQHSDSCFVTSSNSSDVTVNKSSKESNAIMALALDDGISAQADEGSSTAIDFGSFLTSVTIEGRENSWSNFSVLKPNELGVYEVTSDMELRFTLAYKIPENTLSDTKNTISYKLPAGITVKKAESGPVKNTENKEIATYSITEDGVITIVFTDSEYIKGNKRSTVDGFVSFTMDASKLNGNDQGDNGIKFNDKIILDFDVTDYYETSKDLTLTKESSVINEETGEISYTITITSENGTASDVILNDTGFLNTSSLTGNISVSKNGLSTTFEQGDADNGFSLKLGQMSKGDVYTITYTTQLTEPMKNGTQTVSNYAKATSTDSNGKRIYSDDDTSKSFEKNLLEKSGKLNDDGTITWTVKVNESRVGIGGYTLSDVLNGEAYTGNVQISPVLNEKGETPSPITFTEETETTLPITFIDGDKNTYTITYTTTGDVSIGNTSTVNTVGLGKEGEEPGITVTGSGVNPINEYNPLSKKANSIKDDAGGVTATINWSLTVNAKYGDIKSDQTASNPSGFTSYWYVEDYLWDNQWMTATQLKQLSAAVKEALAVQNLNIDVSVEAKAYNSGTWVKVDSLINLEDPPKYEYFRILFNSDLPKGSSFSFSYNTTAPIENLTTSKEFRNEANINSKVWVNKGITHVPTTWSVKKSDQKGSGDQTIHALSQLEDGVLKWEVNISVPVDSGTEKMTILEDFPEGLTITKFELRAEPYGAHNMSPLNEDTTWNYENFLLTVKYDSSSNQYKVTIPKELMDKSSVYHFVFYASVNEDEVEWTELQSGDLSCDFANTVTVLKDDETEVGSDSQTQTITTDNPNKNVQKSHSGQDSDKTFTNNVIPYEVIVNPQADNLVKGSDTITFVDTLNYSYWAPNGSYTVNLVSGSLHVYVANKDENGDEEWTELDSSDYSYDYSQEYWGDGGNQYGKLILTLKVPDSKKLKITYQYQANGEYDGAKISNSAEIQGSSENGVKDDDAVEMKVQNSQAGAQISGVDFLKVDAEHNNQTLTGAEFDLYKWDTVSGDYKLYAHITNTTVTYYEQIDGKNVPITDADRLKDLNRIQVDGTGKIDFTGMDLDWAYKLIETVAPDGYILDSTPYEFYVPNRSSTTINGPSNFTGHRLTGGTLIYLKNQKNVAKIELRKYWYDTSKQEITNPSVRSVNFSLYRRETTNKYGSILFKIGEGSAAYNGFFSNQGSDFYYDTEFEIGSTVKFNVLANADNDNPYGLTVNGQSITGVPTDEGMLFTFSVKVDQDPTEVTISETNTWQFQKLELVEEPVAGTLIGKYTIKPDEDGYWHWSSQDVAELKDLPRAGTNAANQTVYYMYYVVEEESNYYTLLTTSNNDGINSGSITLFNQDNHEPIYTLPDTGGFGSEIFGVLSLGVVITGIGLVYFLMKKGMER